MDDAKMRLWEFGPFQDKDKRLFMREDLLSSDVTTPVPVSGLEWDISNDSLKISYKENLEIENPSKRQILTKT